MRLLIFFSFYEMIDIAAKLRWKVSRIPPSSSALPSSSSSTHSLPCHFQSVQAINGGTLSTIQRRKERNGALNTLSSLKIYRHERPRKK